MEQEVNPLSNIELIAAGLQRLGERGTPMPPISLEIKDKVKRNHSRIGVLGVYHINDILSASVDMTRAFNRNGRQNVDMISQLQTLEPKVAPVIDEDPFF